MDVQHALACALLDGKLALAPIASPLNVLDIGTGTGIWAIEFAEQNPASLVVGTDLRLVSFDRNFYYKTTGAFTIMPLFVTFHLADKIKTNAFIV